VVKYAHPTNPNGIRLVKLDGTSGLTTSDIGETVEGVTTRDTGTLLGYDTTLNYLWVRCDAADDLFDNTSEDINIDSVLCGAMNGVASTSGEELYANVYTLGTIESTPAPQIYIFQAGSVIAEWSTLSNWDRGHIDVLIQVKEMGTEIDGAQITVFARQQGDLFDHFEIDLSNGGRNTVPLSTQADINNTTPDYYIFYDNGNGTNFQPYEIIQDSSSYDWQAEVVTQDEWTSGVGDGVVVTNDTARAVMWDEQLSKHIDSGSAGKALADAGAGTNPWDVAVSGHTSAGTFGELVFKIKKWVGWSRSLL